MIDRDQIRAFIAIELPDELKDMIREFESRLRRPKSRCAKWVEPASIHLTLKFLGNVDLKLVEQVKKSLEIYVTARHPFTLRTGDVGFFPNPNKARVYWLGLDAEDDKLRGLQSAIDESMVTLGFPKEARPFAAHLTLARLKDDCSGEDKKAFVGLVGGVQFRPEYVMKARSVSLMRSQLTPAGAVYTRLAEYRMHGQA